MVATKAGSRRRPGRRGRATGRFEPGEHFAAIPVDVMESEAFAALPDYAIPVLVALAAQYRGQNNGNLSLTCTQARQLGVHSSWKVRAGLQLVSMVGLVERTRQGKMSHGRGVCALFALTWKPVDPTPQAFPPIEYKRPPGNGWAKWKRPENWRVIEKRIRNMARGRAASSQRYLTEPHGGFRLGPSGGCEATTPKQNSNPARGAKDDTQESLTNPHVVVPL